MDDLVERLRICQEYGIFTASMMDKAASYGEAADAIEQLQRQLAEAVANEREACARIMDERAAMYRTKAERHFGNSEPLYSEWEKISSNAEASYWGAAAIRERTD